MILPQMDQTAADGALRYGLPLWAPENQAVVRTTIPTYLCPSAAGPTRLVEVVDEAGDPLVKDGQEVVLGRSHYAASHGQESCWGPDSGPTGGIDGDTSRVADGPFYRNSSVRFANIRDGLTGTVLIGEHSPTLSDKSWAGVIPGAFVHPRIETIDNAPESAATLVLVHSGPSGQEVDSLGNPIIHPPNFPALHVCEMFSDHPGGANVLLGDGAVRFWSETARKRIFADLSSISEGEVVDEW